MKWMKKIEDGRQKGVKETMEGSKARKNNGRMNEKTMGDQKQ